MPPSRRKRSTPPLTLLLIALCVVLVLAAALLRAPLQSALWGLLRPVVALRDSWGQGRVAALEAELASTTAALADRNVLADENARLRAELGRLPEGAVRIAAGVLLRPPGTPYDTLVVDAGQHQGVRIGAPVFAGALAVGVVDEVYADSSRVALYSAPGSEYDALLHTRTTTVPVSVAGQGAGSLSARVPAATDAAVGDSVTFPGLAGGIAGQVVALAGGDTDTFKTLYLRLPANIFALQYVYIER